MEKLINFEKMYVFILIYDISLAGHIKFKFLFKKKFNKKYFAIFDAESEFDVYFILLIFDYFLFSTL